jgi:hypothetical protein
MQKINAKLALKKNRHFLLTGAKAAENLNNNTENGCLQVF